VGRPCCSRMRSKAVSPAAPLAKQTSLPNINPKYSAEGFGDLVRTRRISTTSYRPQKSEEMIEH
jgi:hypothetical protein